jgi:hypothetical protein
MTQISRPFQIALAVIALFGVVWVFALHRHSANPTEASSSSAVSTPAAQPKAAAAQGSASSHGAGSPAAPSSVYHGSAPGVEGLTRAITKAHEAVATSQQNARQLEGKSGQASGASTTGASSSSTAGKSTASATASTPAASAPARSVQKTAKAPGGASRTTSLARQHTVEAELKQGRVVALLFWNPKGADDVVVHRELQLLAQIHRKLHPLRSDRAVQRLLNAFGLELDKPIAIHEEPASQVASFGSFTRGVQVYGTPTILIVGKHGQVTTLTGVQDAYSIEQAMDEVRHS